MEIIINLSREEFTMTTYILKKAGEIVLVTAAAWLAGKMYDKGFNAAKAKFGKKESNNGDKSFKEKLAEVTAS